METKKSIPRYLSGSPKPEIKKKEVIVKASHPSSNPMNGAAYSHDHSHFEVEVYNAFFRIFNL